jgi:hypothetical protein
VFGNAFNTFKPMRIKAALLLGLACLAALFAGCLVVSVYPYFIEKDLVFDQGLLGTWTKADDQAEHWKFEQQGTNAYQLTVTGNQNTNVMQAHLFKLRSQMFLDLFAPDAATDVEPPPIPSHLLLRVLTLTPTVKLSALDHGWLRDHLAKEPKALRHEIPKTNDKPEDRPIVLTADTPELQAFLTKHLGTTEAWTEPFELKRE